VGVPPYKSDDGVSSPLGMGSIAWNRRTVKDRPPSAPSPLRLRVFAVSPLHPAAPLDMGSIARISRPPLRLAPYPPTMSAMRIGFTGGRGAQCPASSSATPWRSAASAARMGPQ
jgi:hypothetical protein